MRASAPADLRAQVQRLWDRGELLRDAVRGDTAAWPLQLTLKPPSPAELADRFDAVRDWVRSIVGIPQLTIEWREWSHRIQGRQRLPAAVSIASREIALTWIGKRRAAEQFVALWLQAGAEAPAIQAWMLKRPLHALALADRWTRLLAVIAWVRSHPRPGVYLREVDAPGVDSKFIEAHRGVLGEWLDLVLPAVDIDATASGVAQFTRRFGFLDKPVRIRFRPLDSAWPYLPEGADHADVTLDVASFAALDPPIEKVFITENEVNFLAFPQVSHALVVFGAGYGWDALARVGWLRRQALHYWGDLDTHGFAILDQLRGYFPDAASFLMDRATLLAHRAHWGEERDPVRHGLSRLTAEEASVYDDLRFDRLQPKLRLEQERVGYGHVLAGLAGLGVDPRRGVDQRRGDARADPDPR